MKQAVLLLFLPKGTHGRESAYLGALADLQQPQSASLPPPPPYISLPPHLSISLYYHLFEGGRIFKGLGGPQVATVNISISLPFLSSLPLSLVLPLLCFLCRVNSGQYRSIPNHTNKYPAQVPIPVLQTLAQSIM